MNPERWREIEAIYNSAVSLGGAERDAYLQKVCAEDESIRKEVETLLACQGQAQHFIEAPALHMAAQALADEAAGFIPQGPWFDSTRRCPKTSSPKTATSLRKHHAAEIEKHAHDYPDRLARTAGCSCALDHSTAPTKLPLITPTDGFRAVAYVENGSCCVISRNGYALKGFTL